METYGDHEPQEGEGGYTYSLIRVAWILCLLQQVGVRSFEDRIGVRSFPLLSWIHTKVR
jgi:hypothetical protein